jgi:hypothetical protein
MSAVRQLIKRSTPSFVRNGVLRLRKAISPPPVEDVALHGYRLERSPEAKPRLSLVIPDVGSRNAFGGVTTSVDFLLQVGKRSGADLRVIVDDYGPATDRSLIEKRAKHLNMDPASIDIVPRTSPDPIIDIRPTDVFASHNCWMTLNMRSIVAQQAALFSTPRLPQISLIQDYEPQFYIFSSTHMMARLAFDLPTPCWGVFNTTELYDYFRMQGHRVEKAFVMEPNISASLRPFLQGERLPKARRLLVYGRPSVPRNCFPAVEKGLKAWIARYPQFASWEIVSAGLPHPPIAIAPGIALRSLGKLSIEDYARLLQTTALGLSLMASPHPSYPPLEMAHFGVLAITNRYANKDLSRAHDNIVSIDDIDAETIADALAAAAQRFERAPDAGWAAQSHTPSFLADDTFDWVDDLVAALSAGAWAA